VTARNLARPSGPTDVVVTRNPARPSDQRDIALIDLLDRLLDRGVVLAGDITLAVADIDLVYVGLRALLSSVAAAEREGMPLP
jgi:hypothetical protein